MLDELGVDSVERAGGQSYGPYLALFCGFLLCSACRPGAVTWGGPMAQIVQLKQRFVVERRWRMQRCVVAYTVTRLDSVGVLNMDVIVLTASMGSRWPVYSL